MRRKIVLSPDPTIVTASIFQRLVTTLMPLEAFNAATKARWARCEGLLILNSQSERVLDRLGAPEIGCRARLGFEAQDIPSGPRHTAAEEKDRPAAAQLNGVEL